MRGQGPALAYAAAAPARAKGGPSSRSTVAALLSVWMSSRGEPSAMSTMLLISAHAIARASGTPSRDSCYPARRGQTPVCCPWRAGTTVRSGKGNIRTDGGATPLSHLRRVRAACTPTTFRGLAPRPGSWWAGAFILAEVIVAGHDLHHLDRGDLHPDLRELHRVLPARPAQALQRAAAPGRSAGRRARADPGAARRHGLLECVTRRVRHHTERSLRRYPLIKTTAECVTAGAASLAGDAARPGWHAAGLARAGSARRPGP
jgi:hypothetical protein